MRSSFLRGIIIGSLLGAAAYMLIEPQRKPEKRGLTGMTRSSIKGRSQTRSVLRNVGKTVNEVGKTMNEYIRN